MSIMNRSKTATLSRRAFVAGSAAAGGGLALGFHLPQHGMTAAAQGSGSEVNAWVVVRPDDTCVIRIAAPRWDRAR
jgi:isoquinoline 1-oxidoreductase beta subunit